MRKQLCIILAISMVITVFSACGAAPEAKPSDAREFTDSLGRTVTLPEKLSKVAVSGPLSQIYVFSLCPELLVGYSNAFSIDAEKYIPERYRALPELGQLYGGKGTMNLEALLNAAPEAVIDVGEYKDGMGEELDKLSAQTGIPFVHIDATMITAPDAFRRLGELIGESAKAEELAKWCEAALERTEGIMARVDADNARKSVIYCLGDKGLNVLANGSFHAQVVSMAAENAAVVESVTASGSGNEVDMEQMILWNPDVLIFQHDSIYDRIASGTAWSQLDAVKNGEYYSIPCGPYGWISSPPAVQCYLGLLWLTAVLYPDYVDYDLKAEVTDYYRLFYGFDMTDGDYTALTGME